MANALEGNIWLLDTASTTTVVESRRCWIKSIEWDGATTAGHTYVIKDKNSKLIAQSTAAGANNEDVRLIEDWHDGFIMHTLGSGKLIVRLG